MTRDDVFKKAVEMLVKYKKAKLTADQITEQTTLLKDLEMNSARLVDMILDFEDEFNVRIEDAEADAVRTVGDCVELIMRKVS